jgi:sulfite dehydrogenase
MINHRNFFLAAFAAAVFLSHSGIAIAPLAAQEQEPPRTLMPGRGVELTTARCVICHDAQHITRAKLSREEWAFNVKNMIERGAPITPEEIPQIVDYLATYYNRDAPPPAEAAAAGAPSVAAAAQDPAQQLLTANACIACHAVDRRMVGPGFREIAQRYRSDPGASELLASKIRDGGAGAWGQVPMPPHPQISAADLAVMVSWIMKQ